MRADTPFPSLVLYRSSALPKEDQLLGGAFINAVSQVFRAIRLAMATAIQAAMQENRQKTGSGAVTGKGDIHNPAFLAGLRAGNYFSVGLALSALCRRPGIQRGWSKGATKK